MDDSELLAEPGGGITVRIKKSYFLVALAVAVGFDSYAKIPQEVMAQLSGSDEATFWAVLRRQADLSAVDGSGRVPGISPRLRQVAMLVAQGQKNAEIADELGLSVFTVRNQVSTILRKLNLQNRGQIAVSVLRRRPPFGA